MARKKKTEDFTLTKDLIKAMREPQSEETVVDDKKTETPQKFGEAKYEGRVGVIDEETVNDAMTILEKYRQAKSVLEQRVKDDQDYFRVRYADFKNKNSGAHDEPGTTSAWLFNSVINKHADAMDNIPTANILPREEGDQTAAESLSKIVPLILDKCGFEAKYSKNWYDKIITGGAIYKIYWDNTLINGLGDINVQTTDVLNLYWTPGIENIQDADNLFHVEYVKRKTIIQQYPFMKDRLGESGVWAQAEYNSEVQNNEHSDEQIVVDWWYKKMEGTKTVVHLCKFCCGEVLWASENTEEYKERGYFDHGRYPFVFDSLFPIKGSPYGFGYVDIMRSPQYVIDKIDSAITKNATMAAKPRWFKKKNCNVDMDQFADWSNDFVDVDGGQLDDTNLRQIQMDSIPPFVANHWENKINELKETSGNRDFSQGSTSQGVTAASAIAALQEAGSKLSRDMVKSSYRAYKNIVTLVVELIRQFYTEDRYFRIDGDNAKPEFIKFNNSMIAPQPQEYFNGVGMEISERTPEFDFNIIAQKMSPFQRESQNQLAVQLFQLGVFNPQMADQVMPFLEMMNFEGIEQLKKKVSENATMYQQLMQMTQLASQMAQQLDGAAALAGQMGGYTQQIMAIVGQGDTGALPQAMGDVSQMGVQGIDNLPPTESTVTANARLRAQESSAPR